MQAHDQAPKDFAEKLINKYSKVNKNFVDIEYVHELIVGVRADIQAPPERRIGLPGTDAIEAYRQWS